MNRNYYSYSTNTISNSNQNAVIWMVIAFVLAIIGAFLVYFLFVKSDKKLDNKKLIWLRDFLDFQSMLIEPIMKIAYIFIALFITLASFSFIGQNFLQFLLILTIGNVIARVTYEFVMILISIWQNTRDINQKMKK